MANLSVRKLDEEVFSKLRMRAAAHGVSMEEEVRQILKQAVTSPVKLGDMALQLFGEKQGVELELPEHTPHEPLNLLL
ncbi:MAG: Arc family DNA-binding protein [Methylobacter sp.]|nr:Arc family DNA-binding protein [Methylobacter sp.]